MLLLVVSLEGVTRLFSELQTERNWIEKEMDKVFREKVTSVGRIRCADMLFFFFLSIGDVDNRIERCRSNDRRVEAKEGRH